MKMRMTPDVQEPVRCSVPGCSCVCFRPGSVQLRSCDRCGHGWVAHASEKLQARPPSSCGPVEVALPGLVLDLSSLALYGAQAIPVRLKILLDRLYSILTPEQVGHILHTLGWSLGDYVRGYMLQYPSGKVLDRWFMATPEEEQFILKQFLRFGETRPIVELMTLQCLEAADRSLEPEFKSVPKSCQPGISRNGLSLLLPFDFPHSDLQRLAPPARELVASSKLTQMLHKAGGKHDGGRGGEDDDLMAQRSKFEPALKIKSDPDKATPPRPAWQQNPTFFSDQELHLRRGLAPSSMSPSLNSSLIPSFPSASNSSSSPLKTSHKPLDSASSSLHPLPSFSSSFFCPFRSSFSPSLHPLPSSLCSLALSPSRAGRKGRVCCGVCGKSFYDKGTLKIHYNAVHLKIKHRCTVAGCSMVFSSLRSRNRHSANPNPRLHMGSGRDAARNTHCIRAVKPAPEDRHDPRMCRDDDTCNLLWHPADEEHAMRNKAHTNHHGRPSPPSPQALSPDPALKSLHAPPRHLLPAQSPSPPSCSPAAIPGEDPPTHNTSPTSQSSSPAPFTMVTDGNPSVTHNFGVTEGNVCTSPCHSHPWRSAEPTPKKKPRKSSMPVKIERPRLDSRTHHDDDLYSSDIY